MYEGISTAINRAIMLGLDKVGERRRGWKEKRGRGGKEGGAGRRERKKGKGGSEAERSQEEDAVAANTNANKHWHQPGPSQYGVTVGVMSLYRHCTLQISANIRMVIEIYRAILIMNFF